MVDQPRDPEQPGSAEPEPAAAMPPPAPSTTPPVPWAPGAVLPAGADPRSTPAGPGIVEGIAWAVGLAAVFVLGRGIALVSGSASAFEAGRVVGSMAAAVLIGLAVRWIWVKVRRRGRVLSPWILFVASLVLLINLTR